MAGLSATFWAGSHLPLSFGHEAVFHGADDLEVEIRFGRAGRLEATDDLEFKVEEDFVREYGPVQFAAGEPTRVVVRGSGVLRLVES